MSRAAVTAASDQQAFRPRKRFAQLSHDHVAFDTLMDSSAFEHRGLELLTSGERHCVAVRGPIGSGKSSFIASVISRLPEDHVGLRVPIVAADDPSKITDLAAMTLSAALDAFELENLQREALEVARADERTTIASPLGVTGGKLGGGPVPAELNIQFNTLREERRKDALGGDRLYGIDRLIQILVANGKEPVFVLEDTEAAIGGNNAARAEAFFDGSIRAWISEVEATVVIAIQDHLVVDSESYAELQPNMVAIDLPRFGGKAADALATIAAHRLGRLEPALRVADVFDAGAIDALAAENEAQLGGNMRLTLASMQGATESAADVGADLVSEIHVNEAIADWATAKS